MRWHSKNFHSLLIEDWDGEYTVFQPDSGKTHYINLMSFQILSFLNQHSASSLEISNHLRELFEQRFDQDFENNIEKILYHFDALGLIKKEK